MVILDLMLPGMDGKDVCRTLKTNPALRSIPVLMLTARSEEVDRIIGLELGADDYVTKPFSPKELILRIKAILRRGERDNESEQFILIGDLSIDIDRHQVRVGDRAVELTFTEFKLLVTLASSRGRVQTREHLLDKVWGYTYEGYARTVDTHIRRLREKLEDAGEYIETVRGVGYRFREREREEEREEEPPEA
jgi:two-component system phosphate regulon response regulator PhoB